MLAACDYFINFILVNVLGGDKVGVCLGRVEGIPQACFLTYTCMV